MNDFYKVFQALMRTFVLKKTAKGVDPHRFTFTPGSTIGTDETVKNEDNKSTMLCYPARFNIEDKKDKKHK